MFRLKLSRLRLHRLRHHMLRPHRMRLSWSEAGVGGGGLERGAGVKVKLNTPLKVVKNGLFRLCIEKIDPSYLPPRVKYAWPSLHK